MNPIQEKILLYLNEHDISNKSLREIGKMFSVDLPQKIKHHILQLEAKNFINIERSGGKIVRISKIVKHENTNSILVSLPIYGSANCGEAACYANQNIEGYIKVSKNILPKNHKNIYILRAVGDSMNKANIKNKTIEDGDYVLVDSIEKSDIDNSYVVSVIDGLSNIKKVFLDKASNQIILKSESTNSVHTPIVIHENDDYVISGKVIDIIKRSI